MEEGVIMLVLSRLPKESIIIRHRFTGDEIKITLQRIESLNQAQISVDASQEYLILREELDDPSRK